jgi:hypothetical protein
VTIVLHHQLTLLEKLSGYFPQASLGTPVGFHGRKAGIPDKEAKEKLLL